MDLENFNQKLKKLMENPLVDHSIDWLGDYIMGHAFWKKSGEGDKKIREVSEEWLRREAPHDFAQSHLDENLLRQITYASDFPAAYRVALFDNWGPDHTLPLMADPNPAVGAIGRNQWNDFRLSLVDELFEGQGHNKCLLPEPARTAKVKELGEFLSELAQLQPRYRLRRLVRLNYTKPHESDYKMVQIERFLRRRFQNTREFISWIKDPSPQGFRETMRRAYNAGAAALASADEWAEDNILPEVIGFRNRLGVTVQRTPVPLIITPPPMNAFQRFISNFSNSLSLENRARRFK